MKSFESVKFFLFLFVLIPLISCHASSKKSSKLEASFFKFKKIHSDLGSAVDVKKIPQKENEFFIIDQEGQVFHCTALKCQVALDLRKSTFYYGEAGLLGIALHPDFHDSKSFAYKKIYLYRSTQSNSGANHTSLLSEFSVSSEDEKKVLLQSERPLMRVQQPQSNHNGGALDFGPHDKLLYWSLGDGGASYDRGSGHNKKMGNAQDLNSYLGKILRIQPKPDLKKGRAYRIPANNPFLNTKKAKPEIFAYGLRNVYRMNFANLPKKSWVLMGGDVGQNKTEEVNIIEAGKNYGWRIREGDHPSPGIKDKMPNVPLVEPIAVYKQSLGRSVVGGVYYTGKIKELKGKYIFADYYNPHLMALSPGEGMWPLEVFDEISVPENITALRLDHQGEIIFTTHQGSLFRVHSSN